MAKNKCAQPFNTFMPSICQAKCTTFWWVTFWSGPFRHCPFLSRLFWCRCYSANFLCHFPVYQAFCTWIRLYSFFKLWLTNAVSHLLFISMQPINCCSSGNMSASGVEVMGFKSWANQVFHTLPMARHHCKRDICDPGHKPQRWAFGTAPHHDTRKDSKQV